MADILLGSSGAALGDQNIRAAPSVERDGEWLLVVRRVIEPARDIYRPSLKTVLDALVECSG